MKFGSNARCRNAYVSTISGGWWYASSSTTNETTFTPKSATSLSSPKRQPKRIHLSRNYPGAEVLITRISSCAWEFNISLPEFYRRLFEIYVRKYPRRALRMCVYGSANWNSSYLLSLNHITFFNKCKSLMHQLPIEASSTLCTFCLTYTYLCLSPHSKLFTD